MQNAPQRGHITLMRRLLPTPKYGSQEKPNSESFRRVVSQECDALLPNLALAVAAPNSDGTVTTTWYLHWRSDFESLTHLRAQLKQR